MPDESRQPEQKDTGLRQMMTWLLIAFVVSIVMAIVGVELAFHFFDKP